MRLDNFAMLNGERAAVGCDAPEDSCRYHVWVNIETIEIERERDGKLTLYKNPPTGAKPRDTNYFRTRHLDPWAKANRKITTRILKDAPHQIRRAQQKYKAEERALKEAAKKLEAEQQVRAAAPFLLDALKAAVRIAEEARKEWDAAPSGMRAGKILIALTGSCPGYRADIDEIHAALRLAEPPELRPDSLEAA